MEKTRLKRRLTAVLLADVVGYSRLMYADEEGTHRLLADYLDSFIKPTIAKYGGRLLQIRGDGLLVEFESALDAVRCGLDIQRELIQRGESVDAKRRMQMRIGINVGDVIVGGDEGDISGNSVNIAARLEGLAEPDQLCVTHAVHEQLLGCADLVFTDKGERRVKNIDNPIRVFRVEYAHEVKEPAFLQRVRLGARRLVPGFLRARFAALLVIASILVAIPFATEWRNRIAESSQVSILVLPFRPAGPDDSDVADAVTDILTTDLSRLSDTVVISPATAFTYKGKNIDPRQIGRECDVRYLVEGSIGRVGDRVQVTAHLIDARSAVGIWADRFENEIIDLLDMQQAVTGRIATSLGRQLVRAESRRSSGDRSANPDPIVLRFRAMALTIDSFTPPHTLAARRYLEESVRLDPTSAASWSQLANLLVYDYVSRWNDGATQPAELLRRAEEVLQKALELDPSLAGSYVADGFIRRAKGDHQGALDAFDRAIELNPNLALAYAQKANQLSLLGRPKEGLSLVLRAIRLSPRDPSIGIFYWVMGRAYFFMKDYENAIIWLRKSVAERSNLWFSRAYLISAYALTGKKDSAAAALRDFKQDFAKYNLKYIKQIYESEIPTLRAPLEELYKGLQEAGLAAE